MGERSSHTCKQKIDGSVSDLITSGSRWWARSIAACCHFSGSIQFRIVLFSILLFGILVVGLYQRFIPFFNVLYEVMAFVLQLARAVVSDTSVFDVLRSFPAIASNAAYRALVLLETTGLWRAAMPLPVSRDLIQYLLVGNTIFCPSLDRWSEGGVCDERHNFPGPNTTAISSHEEVWRRAAGLKQLWEVGHVWRENQIGLPLNLATMWMLLRPPRIFLGATREARAVVRPVMERLAEYDHTKHDAIICKHVDRLLGEWSLALHTFGTESASLGAMYRLHLELLLGAQNSEDYPLPVDAFLSFQKWANKVSVLGNFAGFDFDTLNLAINSPLVATWTKLFWNVRARLTSHMLTDDEVLRLTTSDCSASNHGDNPCLNVLAGAVIDALVFAGTLSVATLIDTAYIVLFSRTDERFRASYADADHPLYEWARDSRPMPEMTHDYALRFAYELTRVFSPVVGVPFFTSPSYRAQEDTRFTFPNRSAYTPGQQIVLHLANAARDGRVWNNPHQFYPRPLREYHQHSIAFLEPAYHPGSPFSQVCPGKQFAMQVLKTFLQRVRIESYTHIGSPPQYFDGFGARFEKSTAFKREQRVAVNLRGSTEALVQNKMIHAGGDFPETLRGVFWINSDRTPSYCMSFADAGDGLSTGFDNESKTSTIWPYSPRVWMMNDVGGFRLVSGLSVRYTFFFDRNVTHARIQITFDGLVEELPEWLASFSMRVTQITPAVVWVRESTYLQLMDYDYELKQIIDGNGQPTSAFEEFTGTVGSTAVIRFVESVDNVVAAVTATGYPGYVPTYNLNTRAINLISQAYALGYDEVAGTQGLCALVGREGPVCETAQAMGAPLVPWALGGLESSLPAILQGIAPIIAGVPEAWSASTLFEQLSLFLPSERFARVTLAILAVFVMSETSSADLKPWTQQPFKVANLWNTRFTVRVYPRLEQQLQLVAQFDNSRPLFPISAFDASPMDQLRTDTFLMDQSMLTRGTETFDQISPKMLAELVLSGAGQILCAENGHLEADVLCCNLTAFSAAETLPWSHPYGGVAFFNTTSKSTLAIDTCAATELTHSECLRTPNAAECSYEHAPCVHALVRFTATVLGVATLKTHLYETHLVWADTLVAGVNDLQAEFVQALEPLANLLTYRTVSINTGALAFLVKPEGAIGRTLPFTTTGWDTARSLVVKPTTVITNMTQSITKWRGVFDVFGPQCQPILSALIRLFLDWFNHYGYNDDQCAQITEPFRSSLKQRQYSTPRAPDCESAAALIGTVAFNAIVIHDVVGGVGSFIPQGCALFATGPEHLCGLPESNAMLGIIAAITNQKLPTLDYNYSLSFGRTDGERQALRAFYQTMQEHEALWERGDDERPRTDHCRPSRVHTSVGV